MANRAAATALGERVRPISLAREHLLPVAEPLAGLLPRPGLQRGTVTATTGAATSLALALVAEASARGSWVAAVSLGRLGLAAAAEHGVAVERLLLVDPVPAAQWPAVVASLGEGVDVVLTGPVAGVAPGEARRLVARLREHGTVLVQVGWSPRSWPERPDLSLLARPRCWDGIGEGHGHLRARRVTVEVSGRRGADRPRVAELWLPDHHGRLAAVTPALDRPAVPDRPALSLVPRTRTG